MTVDPEWLVDAARVREIIARIDSAPVDREDAVVHFANEAQVDILQVKWRRLDPQRDSEWSELYRAVNDALVRFARRSRSHSISITVDRLAADGRAALARCEALCR